MPRPALPNRPQQFVLPPAPAAKQWRLGDGVTFAGRGRQQVRGLVERVNQKSIAVRAENGERWTVDPFLLRPFDKNKLTMEKIEKPHERFRVGDRVIFAHKSRFRSGKVHKLNPDTVGVTLDDDGRRWRIAPVYLRHEGANPRGRGQPERPATQPAVSPPGVSNAPSRDFHPGDAVQIKRKTGEILRGEVSQRNARSISVTTEKGSRWKGSAHFLQHIDPSELNMVRPHDVCSIGERVRFLGRGGVYVPGVVEKLNPKSVGVRADTGAYWKVSPSLIQVEETPASAMDPSP